MEPVNRVEGGEDERRDDEAVAAEDAADPRRALPSLGRLLDDPVLRNLAALYGRDPVTVQARRELAALRRELHAAPSAGGATTTLAGVPERIAAALAASFGPLREVLNATGILLHTNLGRAPLSPADATEVVRLLAGYTDLEVDLATGRRDDRNRRVAALLAAATGAEAALVTNNNAAALVLALTALAAGREVIVSRGELVEIGGSFRIPEILATAGARLVEVGTTNRTRLADYAAAVSDATALLLKVHPSNYRITGFVASARPAELARLGRERGIPVLVDEGSGLLRPSPRAPLRDHPSFEELLAAGCDLVCGSGDKLLGGPQAGLLAGRRELVARCLAHPLYRALRPGRFTYAALETVIRGLLREAPKALDALWPEPAAHRRRLAQVAAELGAEVGAEVVRGDAFLGAGSAPEAPIPGEILALPDEEGLLERLRNPGWRRADAGGEPPPVAVLGYRRDGRLRLDLRTVPPAADAELIRAVRAARRPREADPAQAPRPQISAAASEPR